jgi:hypothetical protein
MKGSIQYAHTINFTGQVVFSGLDKNFKGVLATPNPSAPPPFYMVSTTTPVRPLISDQDTNKNSPIVVRVGNTDTSPIMVYQANLQNPIPIADSSEFNALGQSPGISRDGTVVAFSGDLNSNGTKDWGPDIGPGIFIAVLQNGTVACEPLDRPGIFSVLIDTLPGSWCRLPTWSLPCDPSSFSQRCLQPPQLSSVPVAYIRRSQLSFAPILWF